MPVPEPQEILIPLLEALNTDRPSNLSVNDLVMTAARSLRINVEEMSPMEKAKFRKNIDSAKTYLTFRGLIANPVSQVYMLTSSGKKYLGQSDAVPEAETVDPEEPEAPEEPETPDEPEELDEPEEPEAPEEPEVPEAPEEYEVEAAMNSEAQLAPEPQDLEATMSQHNANLAAEVLARTAQLSSATFEIFVTDLLSKMGYQAFHNARYASDTDSAMIHGLILDPQAASPLYIHADRLSPNDTVGRSDVEDFVEAISDKGGKGLFATTASFSDSAETYAQDEGLLLIDGPKLARLMITHNFCVNVERVYEVKALDESSFRDYEA